MPESYRFDVSNRVVPARPIGGQRERKIGGIERHGSSTTADPPEGNRLLSTVPDVVLARLRPHLEPVRLERKELLFRAYEPLGDVYFPDDAVVSLVSQVESGQTLEVGLVGRDGLVGTAVFPGVTTMPCERIVLIPGLAHRISADVLNGSCWPMKRSTPR